MCLLYNTTDKKSIYIFYYKKNPNYINIIPIVSVYSHVHYFTSLTEFHSHVIYEYI